jgi:hypothetical protein
MVVDIEIIKSIDNTQYYFQNNKVFLYSVSISIILHIFLVVFVMHINKACNDCQNISQDDFGQKLKTYLLKQPALDITPEDESTAIDEVINEKVEPLVTTQSNSVAATVKTATKEMNVYPKQQKAINKQTKAINSELDYSKLRSSINAVVEQDSQNIKEAIFDNCEMVKKKTGALDCVSNIERLGYKKDDPYQLSEIFKSLDKYPDNKKKERLLAKLLLNEKHIKTALNSNDLPPILRQQFEEEIAYIRGEIHYQDCNGKPNSGTCAGEIDLGRIVELLNILFTD